MRSKLSQLLAAILSLLLGVSMHGGDTLRVGGSGVALGGLRVLAKAYERRHPGLSILVLPSIGSTGGIRAVQDGKLDLGCSARPLQPEERAQGLNEIPWVTTAFVFATHATTALEALTLAEVEAIYAGRRTTWRDGRPIRLVLRPRSDTSFAYLAETTPGMRAALAQSQARQGVAVGVTDQEALAELERTPGSFGTTVLGLVLTEDRRVQILTLNGKKPTEPGYPLALMVNLIHRPDASAAALGFLGFLRSKEGLDLALRSGYRPVPAAPLDGKS